MESVRVDVGDHTELGAVGAPVERRLLRPRDIAGPEHAPGQCVKPTGVLVPDTQRDRVADQGQAQQQPDLSAVEAERVQVQGEDDRQEAVPEHPDDARREQERTVLVEIEEAALQRKRFEPDPDRFADPASAVEPRSTHRHKPFGAPALEPQREVLREGFKQRCRRDAGKTLIRKRGRRIFQIAGR